MNLAYKYKLLPTHEQIKHLNIWRSLTARVWNIGLAFLIKELPFHQEVAEYNKGMKSDKYGASFYRFKKINDAKLYKILFTGKEKFCSSYLIPSVLKSLVASWEMYLSGTKNRECPKYKSGNGNITITNPSIRINNERKGIIKLPPFLKIGDVKYIHHRDIGKHTQLSITCDANNHWWMSLTTEVEIKPIHNGKNIAIDLGIKSITADSDGRKIIGFPINGRLINGKRHKVKGNKKANYSQSKLAKMKSRLARMKQDGSNYKKLETRILNYQQEITDRQKFHEHRIANYYSVYNNVVMEDFKPGNLTGGSKKLNRSMRMFRLGSLASTIKYKAEMNGNAFVEVPARYNSQRCMKCDYTAKENRIGEKFNCVKCNYEANADVNGAQNALFKFEQGNVKKKKKTYNTSSKMKGRQRKLSFMPSSISTAGAVAQPDQYRDVLIKPSNNKSIDDEMPEVIGEVQYTSPVASVKVASKPLSLLASENSHYITRLSDGEESGNAKQLLKNSAARIVVDK